jgi:MOSC domain-containing protein YiiM
MATLRSIAYKPVASDAQHGRGYLRSLLDETNLIAGYGIEHDRKGGHPKRNLNVMDDITLAELAAEGYATAPGVLGENLVIGGLDLRTLPEGTHLQVGEQAIIVLGKLREPCEQLTEVDERMPESVIGRVGMMCRVVQTGRIRVGDPVVIVPDPQLAI